MLDGIVVQIKEAVDISAEIKKSDPANNKNVTILWEGFIRDFFLYVQKKGKETNQNIMSGISFARITRK